MIRAATVPPLTAVPVVVVVVVVVELLLLLEEVAVVVVLLSEALVELVVEVAVVCDAVVEETIDVIGWLLDDGAERCAPPAAAALGLVVDDDDGEASRLAPAAMPKVERNFAVGGREDGAAGDAEPPPVKVSEEASVDTAALVVVSVTSVSEVDDGRLPKLRSGVVGVVAVVDCFATPPNCDIIDAAMFGLHDARA